jgi:hypothetical protein
MWTNAPTTRPIAAQPQPARTPSGLSIVAATVDIRAMDHGVKVRGEGEGEGERERGGREEKEKRKRSFSFLPISFLLPTSSFLPISLLSFLLSPSFSVRPSTLK